MQTIEKGDMVRLNDNKEYFVFEKGQYNGSDYVLLIIPGETGIQGIAYCEMLTDMDRIKLKVVRDADLILNLSVVFGELIAPEMQPAFEKIMAES